MSRVTKAIAGEEEQLIKHTELICECKGAVNGDYLRIEIDGSEISRFMPDEGIHKVFAFMGIGASEIKNVRIYREMQASALIILVKELHTDGEFYPLPKRLHKIEVVGDSVTSGEGLVGAQCLEHWIPTVFSSRNNYAIRVAKELNADYIIISRSGYGVYCSWDNNLLCSLPRYYDLVCGTVDTPEVISLGGNELYDFSNDTTDIVIINLGSNDAAAFHHNGWTDQEGILHRMKLDQNGGPLKEDIRAIEDAIYNFCHKIRSLRPHCTILWCYGMLNDLLNDTIVKTTKRYSIDHSDFAIYTVELPHLDSSLNGSHFHLGPEAHRIYAQVILEKLNEILSHHSYNVDEPVEIMVGTDGYVDVSFPEKEIAPYEHILEVAVPLVGGGKMHVTDYASAGKL